MLARQEDRVARFPQHLQRYNELRTLYTTICSVYDRFYEENGQLPRRDFALQAKNKVFKFQLAFGMRDTGLSAHEVILRLLRPKPSALLAWTLHHDASTRRADAASRQESSPPAESSAHALAATATATASTPATHSPPSSQ
jgi:hypothetical protein